MKVNIERIKENLLEMSEVANAENNGYTRLAFSKEEKAALEWLKGKLDDLEVSVSEDAVGNVFGRIGALNQPAIAFGSHLDTVREGGLYDGAIGVIVGLECLQVLKEHGYPLDIPLELICFVGEEANPLGGTFGSRAIAGLIDEEQLPKSFTSFPFTREDVFKVKVPKEAYRHFLELHIEQGSVLEENQNQIGIVHSIAGIKRLNIHIKGKASHSGTTPMNLREDALVRASSLILQVNKLARESTDDIVATIGKVTVLPNSENVVPGEVQLTLEMRGSNIREIENFETNIRNWISDNCIAHIYNGVQKKPQTLSKEVQQSIEKSCTRQNLSYQSIISGANHDANSMTNISDVGMIFIPSKDGLSHHPEEFSSWEDIEAGANTMLYTLLDLSKLD
ncbi:M20 family metallo-hydrolase [Alkalihalobacillus sp. 1P02AB]|uniref:M20 family metallo-hydrolase n=1 Tax=Alkalihalobacillus sp. 1P02AB TaxID=3132260 RepID=UPI0039A598BA